MAINKNLMKVAATAAAVGAGFVAVRELHKRSKKVQTLASAAQKVKEHVGERAAKLGTLTRKSYGRIVDAAVDEFRAMKALSEQELEKLAADVKADWRHVEKAFGSGTAKESDEDEE